MKGLMSLLAMTFCAGLLCGVTAHKIWYESTVGQRLKWYETTCRSPM